MAVARKTGWVVDKFYIDYTDEDMEYNDDMGAVCIRLSTPSGVKFKNGYGDILVDRRVVRKNSKILNEKIGNYLSVSMGGNSFSPREVGSGAFEQYCKEVNNTAEFVKVLSDIKFGDMPTIG